MDARERAREQSKERSGVRVKTESETGGRHTPLSPSALCENIDQPSASHLAKPILRKERLFSSRRGLLTKYSDLNEILS